MSETPSAPAGQAPLLEMDGGGYSSKVQEGLDTANSLLAEYAAITADGFNYTYDDFRSNKLEDGILKMSELAGETKDQEVLYSAFMLIACDKKADTRNGAWSRILGNSASQFKPQEVKNAVERLPSGSKGQIKKQLLENTPTDSPLREVLIKIDDGQFSETGQLEATGQEWSGW